MKPWSYYVDSNSLYVLGERRMYLTGSIETKEHTVSDEVVWTFFRFKDLFTLRHTLNRLKSLEVIKRKLSASKIPKQLPKPTLMEEQPEEPVEAPKPKRKMDLTCRIKDCGLPSKGPKWGFICPAHQSLPEETKKAARVEWNRK